MFNCWTVSSNKPESYVTFLTCQSGILYNFNKRSITKLLIELRKPECLINSHTVHYTSLHVF